MTGRSALLITASDVGALLDPRELLPLMRDAFARYSTARAIAAARYPVALPAPAPPGAGGMLLAPGLVEGIPAYTVKVNAKFPGSVPAIRGVVLLHDLATGELLAMLDSGLLTAIRTGVAGALGADVLARRAASRAAVIGAGAQGRTQLQSLLLMRSLSAVSVFDLRPEAAAAFAATAFDGLEGPVAAAASLEEALDGADIVITSTWATAPFLFEGMVAPGTHITTLGPDQPGKCEVDAGLIRKSCFVCDDRDLALAMGAIGGAGLGADAIHAELGEVIAGAKPGRESDAQITVFGSVGLAFQDLAAAWLVYGKAVAKCHDRCIDLTA